MFPLQRPAQSLFFGGNSTGKRPGIRKLRQFYDDLGLGGWRSEGISPVAPNPGTSWANDGDRLDLKNGSSQKRLSQRAFLRQAERDARQRAEATKAPDEVLWPEALGKKAVTEIRLRKVEAEGLEEGSHFTDLSLAMRRRPDEDWHPFIFQPWGYDEHRVPRYRDVIIAHDIRVHLLSHLGSHPRSGEFIMPVPDVPGEMQTADIPTVMNWMPTGDLEKMALIAREADLNVAGHGHKSGLRGDNVYSTLEAIAHRLRQPDVPVGAVFTFSLKHPQVSDRTFIETPLPKTLQKPVGLVAFNFPVPVKTGSVEVTPIEKSLIDEGSTPIVLAETLRTKVLAYPMKWMMSSTLGDKEHPDKPQQNAMIIRKTLDDASRWRTRNITVYYAAPITHTNEAVYTGHPYEQAAFEGCTVSDDKSVWGKQLQALGRQLKQTYTRFEAEKEALLQRGHLPFSLYYRAHRAMQQLGEIPQKAVLDVSGTASDIRQRLFDFCKAATTQLLFPLNRRAPVAGADSPLIPYPTTWLNTGFSVLKPKPFTHPP